MPANDRFHAFQISTGLGAGNIGDEIMAQSFWAALPEEMSLLVVLFPESARRREPYPSRHSYIRVDYSGNECPAAGRRPGLLVGDTPVTESEGLHWPLEFLSPRLRWFHDAGLPVDAVGVGVDRLETPEARRLFETAFLPVRSWTVRSERCRQALLELGVAGHRIVVAADLAWLYAPAELPHAWARQTWEQAGIDLARPLLVANVVNMFWRGAGEARRALAAALDQVAAGGLQVAFLCNECRDGEFFDHAAATEIAALMRAPATILPNLYYSPAEMLALMACARVAVAQRYHFALQAILSGTVPVALLRGQKMTGLAEETGIPAPGRVDCLEPQHLTDAIDNVLSRREHWLALLNAARRRMQDRARRNFVFLRRYYADLNWPPGSG